MPCNNNQQIRYCLVEIIWLTWTPFICCHTQGLHFKTKKAWRHKAINPVREKEKAIIMWFKSNGGLSIYIILYQQQGRTIFFLDNRQWWQFKTECKPKNIIKKTMFVFFVHVYMKSIFRQFQFYSNILHFWNMIQPIYMGK